MSSTLDLALELVRRPSVTPTDAGCQELLIAYLAPLGFRIERLPRGKVTNLWARRGNTGPLFCFAGHSDVVPSGPLEHWRSHPFQPEIHNGLLYGRGAADMKGSLAAMVTAVETFVATRPDHQGSIAFLITSDEEGPAVDGTIRVMEALNARGERMDWCLIGEPTSMTRVGDQIKNGRRGSLNGRLRVLGKQGHVAYPHLARNPLHACIGTLAKLCATEWDQGSEHFPPTSFQISNLNMGSGVENMIPADLTAWFNFRFSTALDADSLKRQVGAILDRGDFDYELQWQLSGNPFLTPDGILLDATCQAVQEVTGYPTKLSTSGGTSDGRFIAPTGTQVVELGPCSATIHQIDECVGIEELEFLAQIYRRILELLLDPVTSRVNGGPYA